MIRSSYFLVLLFSFSALAGFDWQGHRGARGLYPENTINAMKEAMKFPVTTLEMDVVISKDEKVVVSHEPWMSEETCLDPKGNPVKDHEVNLFALNYDAIKKYDCGSKLHPRFPQQKKVTEHKPLLSELFAAIEPTKYTYNIEIKSTPEDEKAGFQPDYKIFTNLVVAEITKVLPNERFMIQSFDWRVLKHLHSTYPQIRLVALRETKYTPKQVLKELGFLPAVFSPDYTLLNKKDVKFFQLKKIKVIPWTVNTVDDMKKLIYMGIDGIITDYPNLIIDIPQEIYHLIPECLKGFNRFENKCVKVPKNGIPSLNNPGWDCKDGYVQKRNSCIKINLPKNAVFTEDGKTWVCKPGFKRYRYRCQ
jgi:glycerophosphoryl diester phosphodiesterase